MAVNLKIVSQVVASGTPGPAGKSAYQIAVDNGFEGTESEWLKSGLFPFKGWYDSVSELESEHANPSVGEYAYVKGATSSDPVKIYECSTEGTWSDSGRTVDTSGVQTFGSGEAVNEVDITDDSSEILEDGEKIPTAGAVAGALGNAEFSTGEKVKNVGIDAEPTAGSDNLVKSKGVFNAVGGKTSFSFNVTRGEHSSGVDRINVNIKSGETFSTEVNPVGSLTIGTYQTRCKNSGGSDVSIQLINSEGTYNVYKANGDISTIGFYFTTSAAGSVDGFIDTFNIGERAEFNSKNYTDDAIKNLGVVQGNIPFSGASHPAANNKIKVNIKAGETFAVCLNLLSGSTSSTPRMYSYLGATETSIQYCRADGTLYTTTASTNIEYLGFSFDVREAGSIECLVLQGELGLLGYVSSSGYSFISLINTTPASIPSNGRYFWITNTPGTYFESISGGVTVNNNEFAFICVICANGVGVSITKYSIPLTNIQIDTTVSETPSDERVPSTKLLVNRTSALNPIFEADVTRNGSTGKGIGYTGMLTAGVSYRVELSSNTGLTYDTTYGQQSSTTIFIELGFATFSTAAKFYKLYSTQEFKNTLLTVTPLEGQGTKFWINPSRWHSNELLHIKVWEVGSEYDKLYFAKKAAEEYYNDSVASLNKESSVVLKAAKNNQGYSTLGDKLVWPAFLIMTDTHGDVTRIQRALEFGKESNLINAVIHAGDISEGNKEFNNSVGIEWPTRITELNAGKPVLPILGNHDMDVNSGGGSSTHASDYWSVSDIMTNIYPEELQSMNGEIHGEVNGVQQPYWYRDFTFTYHKSTVSPTGYTRTIRIIALHQFEYSTEDGYTSGAGVRDAAFYHQDQIDWFIEQLSICRTNGYGVIILSHMLIAPSKYNDSTFNSRIYHNTVFEKNTEGREQYGMRSYQVDKFFFYKILNAWKEGTSVNISTTQIVPNDSSQHQITAVHDFSTDGGNAIFVANICGHTHSGGILNYINSEENIINEFRVIMCPTSSCNATQDAKNYPREYSGKLQDCLNAVTFDWYLRKVRIVRYGSNISYDMQNADMFEF